MAIILCKFLGLCTAMGEPVDKFPTPYGVRARVERLSDHPVLGAPDGHDFTITSEVRRIDFDLKLIITQNNIYSFGVTGRYATGSVEMNQHLRRGGA